MAYDPGEREFRKAQILTDATRLSMTTTSARVQLTPGMWMITADVDCRILQGTSSVSLSDATKGVPVWAKSPLGPVCVDVAATSYIAALTLTGTGTLDCYKVS